ncbi:hypothetical protein [Amycolatopsis sp. NPDC001319]|uniref:hypothetical protein n=1 Tax=unclassified Amycolatopsis TaxID=2618356 RepID=UPI003695A255
MPQRAPKPTDDPAGREMEMAVAVLTDGVGRYYLPVFVAGPDGGADYVGLAVYDELEAAMRDSGATPDA